MIHPVSGTVNRTEYFFHHYLRHASVAVPTSPLASNLSLSSIYFPERKMWVGLVWTGLRKSDMLLLIDHDHRIDSTPQHVDDLQPLPGKNQFLGVSCWMAVEEWWRSFTFTSREKRCITNQMVHGRYHLPSRPKRRELQAALGANCPFMDGRKRVHTSFFPITKWNLGGPWSFQ